MLALHRRPGRSFPPAARTGDERIDGYLADLDARLWGSSKVRLLTLSEVKDHLLEKKAALLPSTADDETAARLSVSEMGDPEVHAQPQRAALVRRFLLICLVGGTGMFLLTFMFATLGVFRMTRLIGPLGVGVYFGATFGPTMGWFLAFVHAQELPSAHAGDVFVVSYSRALRQLSVFFGLLFAVMGPLWIARAFGLVDQVTPDSQAARVGRLLMALICVFDLWAMRLALRTYAVDRDGFTLNRWFTKERIPWSAVRGLHPQRGLRIPILRRAHASRIEYLRSDGRLAFTGIDRDMRNFDRFVVLLRAHIADAAPRGGS